MRKRINYRSRWIGSFLIQNFLDKVGMYNITVADPDKVEQKEFDISKLYKRTRWTKE